MELPTYTNIWKIEKRLYKLYDFRLPMPIPIGQVAAFLAIAIPYMLVLTLVGMPFSHTWVWLYMLPPGAAAWLVTRPVLEGKRLPELVVSQVRYLTEPRTWCRLAPSDEKDHVVVVARVWRAPVGQPGAAAESDDVTAPRAHAAAKPWRERPRWPAVSAAEEPPAGSVAQPAAAAPAAGPGPSSADPVPTSTLEQASRLGAGTAAGDEIETADSPDPSADMTATTEADGIAAQHAVPVTAPVAERTPVASSSSTIRPVLRVRADSGGGRPLHVVERALRTSRGGWQDRVVVVPGGHRPGSPDHAQRDQARSRLPLAGPARIVVLGTAAGAGQTVTTLLTGKLLASLRGEAVAVLDLSGRPGSLTDLARHVPRLLPSRLSGDRTAPNPELGLQVVTADHGGPGPRDADHLIEAVVARYPITLADPAPADVPRAVQVADQLVLVTPAGARSAGSLAMTLEWLEAHGHARLAQTSVTVLNGVSKQTAEDTARATAVAAGRCRAIVRVPWDSSLGVTGQLSIATVHAYTALAGVLVSGLADPAIAGSTGAGSPS